MAQRKVIVLTVDFDEAHEIPSDDDLKFAVTAAVSEGLLTDFSESAQVDSWDVEIT